MKYWLMKTEPNEFSLDDLKNRPFQTEPWTGVRNYQARNNLRSMTVGDPILFYHSSVQPAGIAGIAEVSLTHFPDPTAVDPKSPYFDERALLKGNPWCAVEVHFVATFPRFLPLEELRIIPGIESMQVLRRGMRLSVQPVSSKEFLTVLKWIKMKVEKSGSKSPTTKIVKAPKKPILPRR